MTAFQKLWQTMWNSGSSAMDWLSGFDASHRVAQSTRVARADEAALRLFSLPRGIRQRSRCFLLDV